MHFVQNGIGYVMMTLIPRMIPLPKSFVKVNGFGEYPKGVGERDVSSTIEGFEQHCHMVLEPEVAHAVLVVYMNGTAYVLDNQIKAVVDHRRIYHYRPIYSLNERNWWYHRRIVR